MKTGFTHRIAPSVRAELAAAVAARDAGDAGQEFAHLERAHVLGQASTYWHTRVHVLMLLWALRNRVAGEFRGQLIRIVGAATKTAIGLVPHGNTGGANVSPFLRMPIAPELEATIRKAQARG